MNFEKAYAEMLDGKSIRRKEWEAMQHMRLVKKEVATYRAETSNYFANANTLLTTGWRVVDGDGTEMTFVEALAHLKQKKTVTRDGLDGGYVLVDNGNLALCKPVESDYMPTYKDLCAMDWETMK